LASDSDGDDSLTARSIAVGRIFQSDQLVAGRYKIVRFIGRGGMGEVYEADDLELRERVALKTVRSEAALDRNAIEHFKREIQLARKVTHPNVCRIFDLGHHHAASAARSSDQESGITFLTMELLSGETLADKLKRSGRIKESEALPLVAQMASGLAAAHAAGIVHRDFKSGNVILVPPKDMQSQTRAVITDFGLARSASASEGMTASSGAISGTPAYMAPEQIEGGEITPSTDIYSLGIVIYEMVSGALPFAADTPLASAVKRLKENPAPLRTLVQGLDPNWDAVTLRCLERNAAARYASAAQVIDALRGYDLAPAGPKNRRMLAVAGVAAALLVLSAGYYLRVRKPGKPITPTAIGPAPVQMRRSVAVLGFKNLSGRPEKAWLSTALSEMITTDLAAGEKLRMIPGENVTRLKVDLSLADADTYAQDTLQRIRKHSSADFVILGSYFDLGQESAGNVRLDVRIQDTSTGETVASVSRSGTETRLPDLAASAGALLRLFDAQAARDLLEKAIAAEPDYPLAHSALAAAWTALGYDEDAKKEAKRAFDLSAGLSREERLWVEARYRATTNDWDKASDIYRTLFTFFPDNLEYGLQLTGTQSSAGKGKDALSTIERLRKLPTPQRDDPRIDLAEAGAAKSMADFRRIEASSARAAAKGEAQGSQLVVAQSRTVQCVALRNLGEPKKATPVCEEARRIYAATGDRGGVATVSNNLANNLYDQGDLGGAKRMYEESLAIYRQIGNKRGAAGALDNIASLLGDFGDSAGAKKLSEEALKMYREINDYTGVGETLNNIGAEQIIVGDLDGATDTFQQALNIWRQTGDRNGVATTLNNLADMLLRQGHLAEAKSRYQEALSTFRETGQKSKSAYPLAGLAEVLFAQGDIAGAKARYEEVLAICREAGDKHQSASALFGLGSVEARQGELATARQRHEEALAIRREIGEKAPEGESLLALAELALEEGRPTDAEMLARTALDEFRTEKLRDNEVLTRALLARSLLAQGKPAEAREQINLAAGPAAKSPMIGVRMNYAIAAAGVQTATGGTAEATRSLKATLTEANKYGYLGYQFEARLALAEIELKMDKTATSLDVLQKEAAAKGFGLIARKATQP
jgi:serine/threonine protein kinase/tetratricopeptide (TPR) repeat protein/TolB-like protein